MCKVSFKNGFFCSLLLLFISIFSLSACNNQLPKVLSSSQPVSHEIFDALLKKHVSDDGQVNYKGFQADNENFQSYLDLLSKNHPNEANWSADERLAYWINAYNAFTIQLILDNYPVGSIKDIGGLIKSTWDINFIKIEGNSYSLNDIEHGIIRKQFDEPRIHFAVNCASGSCPRLRPQAFTAQNLERLLQTATVDFINNPKQNELSTNSVKLSKLFDWYKDDFTKESSLIEFLNQYATSKIAADAKIDFKSYDWSLNDVR